MEASKVIHAIYNDDDVLLAAVDRKSTRLNSSHGYISYAVFCLKKKKRRDTQTNKNQIIYREIALASDGRYEIYPTSHTVSAEMMSCDDLSCLNVATMNIYALHGICCK